MRMACNWLWVAGLLSGAYAQAAQNPPASPAPIAATSAAPAAQSYLPKPSETLDQVIGKTMPGSPLKIELLRLAFVELNPQAFQPGKSPKLRKGVPLSVPDHEALLRRYLGVKAPEPDMAQPPTGFTPSTSEERRRWVQFP
jgi:Tfp pilus assembly protein FimV